MKFKIGDKVRINENAKAKDLIGFEGKITQITTGTPSCPYQVTGKSGEWYWSKDEHLTLINPLTPASMSFLDKIKETFISEPAKTYKRAGLFDESLLPTTEGMQIYLKDLMEADEAFAEKIKKIEKASKEK